MGRGTLSRTVRKTRTNTFEAFARCYKLVELLFICSLEMFSHAVLSNTICSIKRIYVGWQIAIGNELRDSG